MEPLFRQFVARAKAYPERPVLAGPGGTLSYGELLDQAGAFAAGLRARNIGSGEVVGLCLDWTPDLLTALIGTWQAGAAYVPLDPVLPAARLRAMGRAAGPACIIAPPHWHQALGQAGTDILAPASVLAGQTASPVAPGVGPGQLAYVMFTSGSTGKPKGVMVSHGNLAGLFTPFRERFGWQPDDVWSLYHSYAFGYSVWETWGALTSGGCLVPVPAALRADPVQLQSLFAEQGVTIVSQTPSAFRQTVLHEDFRVAELPRLRMVALSGEAVPAADVQRWFRRKGDHAAQLINTYAVTETGGQVTCKHYEHPPLTDDESGDVGLPLAGVDVRLLDDRELPVPDGEVGELYVGGAGVAQGYLHDDALTAERFVQLSLPDGRQRFYRTGDHARIAEDGGLVFVGRADAQFKWHGYRIEAGEIETVLQAHPGVREAAVALRGEAGQVRLVGYYVAGESARQDGDAEFWPAVGPYQVYDDFLYDLMSTDDARVEHFRQVFEKAAPGRVVLDIGTGDNALLARLCVEAGARHAYAVEVLPDAAARARETVAKLGLSQHITVIEGDIGAVSLPEPADLVTQGIIGNIGSADGIIPLWNAAIRLFARDTVAVPARCRTWIAPAELPARLAANPHFGPLAQRYADRVYRQRGGLFDIRLCVRNFPADGLLAAGVEFEDLDFGGRLEPAADGAASFIARRAGRLDGFLLWTDLDGGGSESLDYFATQQAWLPVFFPLPRGGVDLAAGEVISVAWQRDEAAGLCPDYRLEVRLRDESHTYISRHEEQQVGGTVLHRRLHAAAESSGPGPEQLRAWLAERLPDYMIPTAWVSLPALPLNANAKLDRDRLPDPGHARPALATPVLAPRDELELRLVTIWSDALKLDQVGIEDNFFDLGGDSIAAVRVISRVQRELDAPLGLAALFDAPTVAGLAERLREQGRNGAPAAMEEGVL